MKLNNDTCQGAYDQCPQTFNQINIFTHQQEGRSDGARAGQCLSQDQINAANINGKRPESPYIQDNSTNRTSYGDMKN